MQNIPGIELEKATEQIKAVSFGSFKKGDQHALFADLFEKHSTSIENELALAPVSSKEKMLDATPKVAHEKVQSTNASNVEAPVKEDRKPIREEAREQRMTKDDFDEVKEDLKEYGMTEKEIAAIEEKVNSDEGMTWGQFVSVVAKKMADMRKVEMTDEQKDKLNTFFAKFGFTPKESAKLISQLENGEQAKVMAVMQAKVDNMPKEQQLLITKDEIQAFSTAMNFSKEFTSKIKELFGQHKLSAEVKEAFTMIRQEMADMDRKDQELVRSVGKVLAKAMGEKVKETSVAKEVGQAVDLKPRVSEDEVKAEPKVKEELKEAVDTRKEYLPGANAKTNNNKAAPVKAEANKVEVEVSDQSANDDSNETWKNFFGKLQDDNSQSGQPRLKSKADDVSHILKMDATDLTANSKAKAWEKVSAPKVMKQVEHALFKNLADGTKQLTVELTPENLGKLNIMLQVQGKEVSAVIRAESADAAKILNENIEMIKNSLENQGLKVEKLEVQTGLSGNQDSREWFGQEQHNMARDREAMIAMRGHMKKMRGENIEVARDMQNMREQAINAGQGLHVIA